MEAFAAFLIIAAIVIILIMVIAMGGVFILAAGIPILIIWLFWSGYWVWALIPIIGFCIWAYIAAPPVEKKEEEE